MEAVRGLGGVFATPRVQERAAGGNKRQADAFREALREREGAGESGSEGIAAEEAPVRTRLQQQPQHGRKDDGARHVDVIA